MLRKPEERAASSFGTAGTLRSGPTSMLDADDVWLGLVPFFGSAHRRTSQAARTL